MLSMYLFLIEVLDMYLEDLDVNQAFLDVVQEISGLSLSRVMELKIDLVPCTVPISKAAYRMAPKLLNEMKKQLVELCKKG